jgi:hypothetical protein
MTADLENFSEAMEIVSLLKDQEMLSNRILRIVSTFVQHATKLTPSELCFYVQVYTSDEMMSVTDIIKGMQ